MEKKKSDPHPFQNTRGPTYSKEEHESEDVYNEQICSEIKQNSEDYPVESSRDVQFLAPGIDVRKVLPELGGSQEN